MNNLNYDILTFEFIKYLTLKERYIINQINKNFNNVCKKSTYYQIGTCIANFIKIDFDNLLYDKLQILKIYNFHFMKGISKFLLNEKNNNRKSKINTYFSEISVREINSKTIDECTEIISNRKFLSRCKTNKYNSKYFIDNFPNLNSLLLC